MTTSSSSNPDDVAEVFELSDKENGLNDTLEVVRAITFEEARTMGDGRTDSVEADVLDLVDGEESEARADNPLPFHGSPDGTVATFSAELVKGEYRN